MLDFPDMYGAAILRWDGPAREFELLGLDLSPPCTGPFGVGLGAGRLAD